MSKVYGMMVTQNTDGTTSSSRIKSYATYDEMIADKSAGKYGIVLATNTVYHNTDNGWIVGFPNVIREDDYTAFEVFAHDYEIPVGECVELGGYVSVALPACMAHQFTIRSVQQADIQNVVVDWGDGDITSLRDDISPNIVYTESGDIDEYEYVVSHSYDHTGKYIVRIYGNSYFALKQSTSTSIPNIMSRALDIDLPVASHISNFSSFCRRATHLLNVNVGSCYNFNRHFKNISYMFAGCSNLLTAFGFSTYGKVDVQQNNVFHNCGVLVDTDYKLIPITSGKIAQTFRGCSKMTTPVENFFEYFYVMPGADVGLELVFQSCTLLNGTIPAEKLWDNRGVNWVVTKPFTSCPLVRNQLPKEWSGIESATVVIKPSLEERIIELENKLAAE